MFPKNAALSGSGSQWGLFKMSFCRSSTRNDFLKESFVSAAEHDFCLLSFMIFLFKMSLWGARAQYFS